MKDKNTIQVLILILSLVSIPIYAQTELDFSFIHGRDTQIPDILKKTSGNIPGQYLVDLFLNGRKVGRQTLTIKDSDIQEICFSADWLKNTQLPINYAKMVSALNQDSQCYYFSKIQSGGAVFDYGRQTLKISLPQLVLLDNETQDKWNFGSPGFNLSYNFNGNKSYGAQNSKTLYGDIDLNVNYNRWVLSTKISVMSSDGFRSPDFTLSTPVQALEGDLIFGKSYTRTSVIPDFPFYGVSLRSNGAMIPWSQRGYAPVIDGVLNSIARITIKQGDYILYSKVLPAGPYSLTDISPISNGDISVTIEESNGKKSVRTYPVTTLSSLLRENDFNYNFATGIRNSSSQLDGLFGLASLDYGLNIGTINAVSILHNQYQSIGSGLTFPMGNLGAFSVSMNMAWSHYDNTDFQPNSDSSQRGISTTVQYAKSLGNSTNLQLLTYRYTGEGYTDFSGFNPHSIHLDNNRSNRYEAIITQRMGTAYLNASGWTQEYRYSKNRDIGVNVSLSGTIYNGISLGLTGSYINSGATDSQYNTSFNISIPFTFNGREQFVSSSLNYNQSYGMSFNTGMSYSSSEAINNNLNINIANNKKNASLYTGITFDAIQTGFSVSQSDHSTALSANMSGSVAGAIGVGLAYSHQQSDTIAIAHIDELENIKFNNSTPTNKWGNTIVPLTNYQQNSLTIETNNIPDNVELLESSYNMFPTEKAILVKDFKYVKVNRYILRVKRKNGMTFPMGTQVKTDKKVDVGFIANQGVLLATLLSPSTFLTIQDGSDICKLDISNIKANNYTVTDVTCL